MLKPTTQYSTEVKFRFGLT